MRKYFLQALLCLLITVPIMAQEYIIEDSVLIGTRDGAQISAIVVRKKGVVEKQSAILQFTVYARNNLKSLKEAADKGYVGMMAYTRGKRYSPDEIVPYEHDGSDVHDVITWITQQPWSDQKVGMYGGSYNGFTQWAATKHLHPALKTIVPSVACAPGLDVPMTNNVVMSFVFPWTYYVSNNKFLDEADYNNPQWNELYEKWFAEGRAYRALDTLMGRPVNKMFQRWMDHPSYDKYWQDMIPYKTEFAKINIPVLTTTGYYDGGQIGALYYMREHLKYNPHAGHYLIIGPYGHFGAQGYPDTVYNGYKVDPAALIPIHDIIWEWFDHILKGGPRPAVLKDKINYQVMGTNEWRHAPSLEKMSTDTLTFYLHKDVQQVADFTDRTTWNSYYFARRVIWDSLPQDNGVFLISEPLKASMEIGGCFSGAVKVMINKKDMDYSVVLFEQLPDGKYFYLSYFMGRASYAEDPSVRRLLTPGKKETIPFSNTYLTGRKVGKGSRIVAILNVNKSPFEQINYGTGKEVNEETVRDAGAPLQIRWYGDSYIRIPVTYKGASDH